MRISQIDDEKLYSMKEVAKILKIGRAAVWMAIKKKRMKSERPGYKYQIYGKEIKEYLRIKHKRKTHSRYWSARHLSDKFNCPIQRIYYLTYKNIISRKKIPELGFRYDMNELSEARISQLVKTKYLHEKD